MLIITYILSCWKEIICFDYALFVIYVAFVNVGLMIGCHGDTNLDHLFVNLILVLISRYWLHNMCINNQFDPLFTREILLE